MIVRSDDQDGTITGIFHNVFDDAMDCDPPVFLGERRAQYHQIEFSILDLLADFCLSVADL